MKFLNAIFSSFLMASCQETNEIQRMEERTDEGKILLRYNISIIEMRNLICQKSEHDPFLQPGKYDPYQILSLSGISLKDASIGMSYSTDTLIVEATPTIHKDIQLLIGRSPLADSVQ